MNVLVVTNPFGGHGIGHCITDPAEIARVLAGENAHHVVPSYHDIEPAEEVKPLDIAPARDLADKPETNDQKEA